MNQLSSQYIADIITEEMNMPVANVWLRDQNRKIPADQGLYIIVGIVSASVISAESRMIRAPAPNAANWDQPGQTFDGTGEQWDQPYEVQAQVSEVQAREMVQIDIMSRSNDGIFRQWEVVAALNSFYAQQQQEANSFKICRVPTNWINTSAAEGSSILNRYTITFPCFVWYRKTKVLTNNGGDYYDDFTVRVDTEATIASQSPTNYDINDGQYDQSGQVYDQVPPIIQFEINQEGIEP